MSVNYKVAFMIMIPCRNRYIYVREGCGGGLTSEDVENGYCDYAEFDVLRPGLNPDGEPDYEIIDGGQLLLIDGYRTYDYEVIANGVVELAGFEGSGWNLCKEISEWNALQYMG